MGNQITPGFFYDLTTVANPAISPDGKQVAFVKSRVDREQLKSRSHIVMADVESGELREFTGGDADALPRWSPDAASLAFLRTDDAQKKQIWVMPTGFGEGRAITGRPGGVSDFEWSPDSSRIVFQSSVDPRDEDPDSHLKSVVVNRLRYKADGFGLLGNGRVHLFTINADGSEENQITEGDFDNYGPAWSPEGARVAFISARHPNREWQSRTELYVVDATGGQPENRSAGLYAVGGATWSPDGERIAMIGTPPMSEGGACSIRCQGWVYVLQPGEDPKRVTPDTLCPVTDGIYDLSVGQLDWLGNGRVLFQGDSKGVSFVCSAPGNDDLDDIDTTRHYSGGGQISAWSVDGAGETVAVAQTTPSDYGNISVIDLSSGRAQTLTGYNDDWFATHPPARIEKLTYERAGVELEARLLFPPDFDATSTYPLLLEGHGGPHSAFYDTFYPLHQLPASAGYVVLAINPQGSSTYGRDFACAAHDDWGGEPYEQLMAGVELVVQRPYIDADRVVMHGSSYGGYMGSWMAGHTDRFRAIAIGAPVTNIASFFGTSDIGIHFSEIELGGGRFDNFEEYLRHSPLTYAPEVNTPVLILHGEDDDRVPMEQGEQYFTALRRLGKEVEFVRMPGSCHGLSRNPNFQLREEYYARILGWFAKYLD